MTKWHLSSETTRLMREFHETLSADLEELRREFEEHPESFRDSERGIAVGAWLENLESISDDIEEVSND